MKNFRESTYRPAFIALFILALGLASTICHTQASQGGFINPGNRPAPPGSIPGVIDVSGSGAATYTIPIELPEGIGGVMPTLAITYSSQAGNGLLGYGWNLAGISAITRVPKTMYYDGEAGYIGLDSNDRFALDGQRLLVISGNYGANNSRYSTENYSFDDIRSLGGTTANPNSFKITTTDGTILEYSHKIITPGTTSTVYMWILSKVTDRRGNYVEYVYVPATGGQVHLSQIKYTGNQHSSTVPLHTINFSYGTKEFQYIDYYKVASYEFLNDLVINEITISNGRRYSFEYNKNRLQLIRAFQGNTLLKNPTQINWGNDIISANYSNVTYTGETLNRDISIKSLGDFTGDGKNELFVLRDTSWALYTMNGNTLSLLHGGARPSSNNSYVISTQHCTWINDSQLNKWGDKLKRHCYTSVSPQNKKLPFRVSDFTGDGIMEIGFVLYENSKFHLALYQIKNGALQEIKRYTDIGEVRDKDLLITGDFVGKGSPSIIIAREELSGDGHFNPFEDSVHMIPLAAGIDGQFVAKTANSDKQDLYLFGDNSLFSLRLDTVSSTEPIYKFKGSGSVSQPFYPLTGDFKGDGLLEIIKYNTNTGIWVENTGITGSPVEIYLRNPQDYNRVKDRPDIGGLLTHFKNTFITADFNGDGKDDILKIRRRAIVRYNNNCPGQSGTVELIDPWPNNVPECYSMTQFKTEWDFIIYYSRGPNFSPGHTLTLTGPRYTFNISGSTYTLDNPGTSITGNLDLESNFDSNPYLIVDFLNNGLPELLISNRSGTPRQGILRFTGDDDRYNVKEIVNGNGLKTQLNYKWLHDPTIYTLSKTMQDEKIVERHLPWRVVSGIKTILPTSASTNTTISDVTYKYNTARLHRQRGFMGFKETDVYDDISKMRNISVFDIDTDYYIPYLKETTTRKNTANLARVENEPKYITKGNGLFMQEESKTTHRDLLTGIVTFNRFKLDPDKGWLVLNVDSAGTDGHVKTEYIYNQDSKDPTMIRTTRSQGGGTFIEVNLFEYFPDRNLKKTTDNNGIETTFTYHYDKTNIKTTLNLTTGITNELFYDSSQRFVIKSETKKDGVIKFNSLAYYDSFGRPDSTRCINNRKTSYAYDVYGQLTKTTNPDNSFTTFSYGWENDYTWYTKAVTSLGDESWVYYDLAGREVSQKVRPAGGTMVTVTTVYNTDGTVKETNSTLDGKTEYVYWSNGRLRRVTAKGRTVNYSYLGNQVTKTINNVASTERFNALGQLIEATDPGGTITYQYHPSGQPSHISNNGVITRITYDTKGRQDSLIDPNAGITTFTYDNLNRIINQKDGNGVITTLLYDPLGRLSTKTQGARVVNYTYDPLNNKGALQAVEDMQSGIKVTYNYDPMGRISSQTERISGNNFTFSYTYDSHGRMATMTYPSGFTIANAYNGNYLTRIRDNSNSQNIIYNILYNSRSQISEYATLSGPKLFQTFDSYGYPKTTEIGTNQTNHTRRVILDYNFNAATQNLTSRAKRTNNGSTTVAGETFTYDPLDRLTAWNVTVGSTTENYTLNYANNGNITQKSDMGVYQYHTQKQNAVVSVSNLQGTVISTRENEIQYTPFNKTSVINMFQDGNLILNYNITYGPDDQRRKTLNYNHLGASETIYVNGGLYEERSNGDMLHYIATPAGLSALVVIKKTNPSVKDIYYLYNDHLGSLIAATKRGSTVLEEFSYDPWGRRRNPNNWNDYNVTEPALFTRGYTGHEHIGSFSLINMNGRMYDPRLGRFLSPDPYVQEPDFSQSFNRYAYCFNNPLVYVDPDGEIAWFVPIIIGAAIFGTGNLVAHAVRGDVNSFGDGLKYFGQGALAGAVLGAAWQFAPLIPGIGPAIQTGMTIYGKVHLYGAAASTISGLGQGIFTGDWNALGNAGQIFLGNFYLDENRSFFGGVWQGTSRHTWEFIQTGLGHSIGQFRNTFGGIDDVDYFGGATLINSNDNSGHMWGFTLGSFINSKNLNVEDEMFRHEYGHTLQGERWGLLYPFVIGIPSAISSNFTSRERHRNRWYERGANRYAERYYRRYLPNNLILTPWDDIRYPRN